MKLKDILKTTAASIPDEVADEFLADNAAEVEEEPKKKKPEPHRTRDKVLKLRLSSSELEYITEQAKQAGMSRTDYLMASVYNNPVIVLEGAPEIFNQLRRQGTNLNQLVRITHQTRNAGYEEALATLEQCHEAQAELKQFCRDWGVKLSRLKQKGAEHGHNEVSVEQSNSEQGNSVHSESGESHASCDDKS